MSEFRTSRNADSRQTTSRSILSLFYHLQESALGYRLTQLFGYPTIQCYKALIRAHVPQEAGRRILEIGCGTGSSSEWFAGEYTGIDINPDYIGMAQRQHTGTFRVMNAAEMSFARDSFDDAVSIATAHHLSDEQVAAMVRKATEVAGRFHIIDAIFPVWPNNRLKHALFRMDRGRHTRSFEQLRDLVSRHGLIESTQIIRGSLHDVGYLCVARKDCS